MPNSVTDIGSNAFSGCKNIKNVTLPSLSTLSSLFPSPAYTSITNVTVAFGATSLCEYFCYNCKGLQSISIPNTVTSIGNQAFYSCTSLKTLVIPRTVTSIGSSAFSNSGLKTLYLPSHFKGNTSGMGIPSGCTVVFYDGNTPFPGPFVISVE